jgi:hypothetical protein
VGKIKKYQLLYVESASGSYPGIVVDVGDKCICVESQGKVMKFNRDSFVIYGYSNDGASSIHGSQREFAEAKARRGLLGNVCSHVAQYSGEISTSQLRQIAAILKVAEQDKE